MVFPFPRRRKGRQSAGEQARYDEELEAFCQGIQQIKSTLDFDVTSRGWAYICENRRILTKAELDRCQIIINDCRKSGALPLDICATDETRAFDNLEYIDDADPGDEAENIVARVHEAHLGYRPISFWDNQEFYVQMVVEKLDLKSLFTSVCACFRLPIASARGWGDLNMRADMMRRFDEWESEGKECVLLYCGDHDPGGLHISDFLRSNMEDLSGSVGWSPDDVIIDRFGLNADFIEANHLVWIDNLIAGSGICLSNPEHADHYKPYVQSYIERFRARKVEANALVVAPEAGRALCEQAILKYVDLDAVGKYRAQLGERREQLRDAIGRLMNEWKA
jgi:hypothetical protein